jgi:hypothetical protein
MTEVPEKVIVHDSGIPPMRVVYPENLAGMVCFWSKNMEPGETKPGRALIIRPAGYELYYSNFVDPETARSLSPTIENGGLGGEYYFYHKGRMMLSIFRPSVKKPNVGRRSFSGRRYAEWERG